LTEAPQTPTEHCGSGAKGTGALLADDDPESLDVLQELVIHEGATARTALDATEVFEILRTWTPDVILIDIGMPVVDGLRAPQAHPSHARWWINPLCWLLSSSAAVMPPPGSRDEAHRARAAP
jgi:CheY-like chemotaxis protein